MATTHLLIFAKYPTPGEVMTRLCPPLNADEAADVQRACIRLLCERAFRVWPVRPTLVVSPDDSEEQFRALVGPYIPLLQQGDGDLGERLARAAGSSFDAGATEVMIIGSDSPTIPEQRLIDARDALGSSDLAIGPCDDGGFYLLALKRLHDDLFRGVEWSTDRTAHQAVAQARSLGFSVSEIAPWYDIDRFEDLARTAGDIRSAGNVDDFELLRTVESALTSAEKRKTGAKK